MKIYFACSIRGGRDDAELYHQILEALKSYGTVLSEVFADGQLSHMGSAGTSEAIYAKDTSWIREADVIIAEVTTPSLGVGYEISKAEEWGKPVLALYRPQPERRLSAMIDGSPKTTVMEYTTVAIAEEKIAAFFLHLAR